MLRLSTFLTFALLRCLALLERFFELLKPLLHRLNLVLRSLVCLTSRARIRLKFYFFCIQPFDDLVTIIWFEPKLRNLCLLLSDGVFELSSLFLVLVNLRKKLGVVFSGFVELALRVLELFRQLLQLLLKFFLVDHIVVLMWRILLMVANIEETWVIRGRLLSWAARKSRCVVHLDRVLESVICLGFMSGWSWSLLLLWLLYREVVRYCTQICILTALWTTNKRWGLVWIGLVN